MSRQSGGDGHVDLDQKNSDSIYYDEQFMPDFQTHHRQKKERKRSMKPQQSKSQRKRVLEKKMKFIELTKEIKSTEKKSTMSREEMRMQRHLYIMQNPNTKNKQNSKKTKQKNVKKNVTINPKFNLEGKSLKEYMKKQWATKTTRESKDLEIESQDEVSDEIILTDRQIIYTCCAKYFGSDEDTKTKFQHTPNQELKNDFNSFKRENINGGFKQMIPNQLMSSKDSAFLEKRNFSNAFPKKADERRHYQEMKNEHSLMKESNGEYRMDPDSRAKSKNLMRKMITDEIVYLDLTKHFKKYTLFPPIN